MTSETIFSLLPLLEDTLSPTEFEIIFKDLENTRFISSDLTQQDRTSILCRFLIDLVVESCSHGTILKEQLQTFRKLGKFKLCTVVENVISENPEPCLIWLLNHWRTIIAATDPFIGLEYYLGTKNTDVVDSLLHIAYVLAAIETSSDQSHDIIATLRENVKSSSKLVTAGSSLPGFSSQADLVQTLQGEQSEKSVKSSSTENASTKKGKGKDGTQPEKLEALQPNKSKESTQKKPKDEKTANNPKSEKQQNKKKSHNSSNDSKTETQQNSPQVEVRNEALCMEMYNCNKAKFVTNGSDHVIQFRLITDGVALEGAEPYVHMKSKARPIQVVMHKDHMSRFGCFHAFVRVPKETKAVIYKYLLRTKNKKETWENLPKPKSKTVLYREVALFSKSTTLFDVANFGGLKEHQAAFEVMHARMMMKHLPSIADIETDDATRGLMPLALYIDLVEGWWSSAGVKFNDKSVTANTLQSAAAEFQAYVEHGCQDASTTQAIVGYLAVALIASERKIQLQLEQWKKVCIYLCLESGDNRLLKLVFETLVSSASIERWQNALKSTVREMRYFPHCLMLFPLYYFLRNKGSAVYRVEMWNEVVTTFKVDQIVGHLRAQPKQELLVQLKDKYKKVIQSFSHFSGIYQKALTIKSVVDVLQKDHDFCDIFNALDVLPALEKEFGSHTCQLIAEDSAIAEWIFTKIEATMRKSAPSKSTAAHNNTADNNKLAKSLATTTRRLVTKYCNDDCSNRPTLLWLLRIFAVTPQTFDSVRSVGRDVISRTMDNPAQSSLRQIVEIATELVNLKMKDENLTTEWRDVMIPGIYGILRKEFKRNAEEMLRSFMALDQQQTCPEIQKCFSDVIFAESFLMSKEKPGLLSRILGNSPFKTLVPVYDEMLLRTWSAARGNRNERVVHFMRWPFAPKFFQLFEDAANRKLLSETAKDTMKQIKSYLAYFVQDLISGNLTEKELSAACTNSKAFLSGASVLLLKMPSTSDSSTVDCAKIKRIIDQRKKETKLFEKFKKEVGYFNKLAMHAMGEKFNLLSGDLAKLKWFDIFAINADQTIAAGELILFGITPSQAKILEDIHGSRLDLLVHLRNIWTDLVKNASTTLGINTAKEGFSISLDLVESTWLWFKHEMHNLRESVDNGCISLAQVDSVFDGKKEIEKMLREIWKFTDDVLSSSDHLKRVTPSNITRKMDFVFEAASAEQWLILLDEDNAVDEAAQASSEEGLNSVQHAGKNAPQPCTKHSSDTSAADLKKRFVEDQLKNRSQQIRAYFFAKSFQKRSKVLCDLKDCLKLQGDFGELDYIQNPKVVSGSNQLSSINERFMTVVQMFENCSEKKCDLVAEFVKAKKLVDWLQSNMADRKEMKALSDLAMVSAGDTPMEVDKVACFRSAVMGFAPFLFDLRADRCGLQNVLDSCNQVSEYEDRDERLIKNWKATADCLDWLKGVKSLHGSGEKSSLLLAGEINSHGVYTISCGRHREAGQRLPTVESAVSFELLADSGHKKMSLDELRDLQSRLLLIADQGLDDVHRFINNLGLVENLAKALVTLVAAGSLLFDHWTAEFKCSGNDQSSDGKLEMRFDDDSPPISCCRKTVTEMIAITQAMEDFLVKWNENLSEKRSSFYDLNHFDILQITYLCRQLAQVTPDTRAPDQVYTLLSSVKEDVTHTDLIECLSEASKPPELSEEDDADDLDMQASDESLMTVKLKIVRKLMREDIPEGVAKAAVQHVENKSLTYDDLFLWCLEHESDDISDITENVDITDLANSFDQDIGLVPDNDCANVVQSIVEDQSCMTLQQVIVKLSKECVDKNPVSAAVRTVCERYLEDSKVTSLRDCVSLVHLGRFVNELSSRVDQQSLVERHLPAVFPAGKAHLVLCSERDTISTLLSLYMRLYAQPLPGATEVLLCCEATTKEDVELLLRRAIQRAAQPDKRLYCIAASEKLSFDVASFLAQKLMELKKANGSKEDFQLVILCCDQQHYIASLFHENKAEYSTVHTHNDVQTYLEKKLTLAQSRHPADVTRRRSVLLVGSNRAGLGKSLHISRLKDKLETANCHKTTVRFLEKQCDRDDVMRSLRRSAHRPTEPHFVHIDVTPSVQHGVDRLLFELVILGSFKDSFGYLWKKQPQHLYCIEYTFLQGKVKRDPSVFTLLPSVKCLSPRDVVNAHPDRSDGSGICDDEVLMDRSEFLSATYQRPYQYLLRLPKPGAETRDRNDGLDSFAYKSPAGDPRQCIETLLEHCSTRDPTWSELCHFVSFLDCQLRDCEKSVFCNEALTGVDSGMSGFKKFVMQFMMRMSQDFATPSLEACAEEGAAQQNLFEQHQLRRRWEQTPHPYLFFNEDRVSLSFVNFMITNAGSVKCTRTNKILEKNQMSRNLVHGLKRQGVDLKQSFDSLDRRRKLKFLCDVMGLRDASDPDPSYQLTVDNVVKMLAIHMRFRCNIPVVIMGETGCGKTRMVEFLSKLKAGNRDRQFNSSPWSRWRSEGDRVQNMVIVKVHGGVDVAQIQKRMKEAAELARSNKQVHSIDTLLFLDEANTTEAIYAIKEFVCDRTIRGEPIDDSGLRIICACNPYKKHSKEFVEKLESAGLGFRVRAEDTHDRLDDIPMRCLVYRVVALPPSMQPLVWDFGQLQTDTEKVYIKQLVAGLSSSKLELHARDAQIVVDVLAMSQAFMREKRDECHYVSLRDVERCLVGFEWFYANRQWLFSLVDQRQVDFALIPVVWRCLIQAVGMCYLVTLEARDEYKKSLRACFQQHGMDITERDIQDDIVACQMTFLEAVSLAENIAHNEALRENVFMMIMCIEMRIPLFLIGKPGSSKSLAKTVVADAMQGMNSSQEIFKKLKEVQVLSFQCSPVSDAVGIEALFSQCRALQQKHARQNFTAVAVLDEIGLAEDSPKMPLKVLHPLLESGTTDGNVDTAAGLLMKDSGRRVGFVGISNWALDPAKMNRGIFVHRGNPSNDELKVTAKGIFSHQNKNFFDEVEQIVDLLTDSYEKVCTKQDREFFGLRDYYSLLKMIFAKVSTGNGSVRPSDIVQALIRNFSGGVEDCLPVFFENLKRLYPELNPRATPLKQVLLDNLRLESPIESRYLLLMSVNFSSVNLLSLVLDCSRFEIIFGSSFPQDDSYTKVCKDINHIKRCMEEGRTAVLLNLRDLYESLYDALNQHYVHFATQRYVDLGLGGHRVKCRVHRSFRLIVIDKMSVVYEEFPVPLINRLEKHIFTTSSILSDDQKAMTDHLGQWTKLFSRLKTAPSACRRSFAERDVFVGYTDETAASAVLAAGALEKAQERLLNTAAVDSLFRLHLSDVSEEAEKWQRVYFERQEHDSLYSFLRGFVASAPKEPTVVDVFSFSQMLSESDRQELERRLDVCRNSITLLTLQQFQTVNEYRNKIEMFLDQANEQQRCPAPFYVLLIQCPQAHTATNLTPCAKYETYNILRCSTRAFSSKIAVCFLHALERDTGFHEQHTGFCSPKSSAVFVDDFRIFEDRLAAPGKLRHLSVREVFENGYDSFEATKRCDSSGSGETSCLNFGNLLRSCVSLSLVKLKSQAEADEAWRTKKLFNLFFDEDPSSQKFVSMTGSYIVEIVKQREEEAASPHSWIINEACSLDALHEGGSFIKTLWLYLKKLASTALAYVVSQADDDRNLDIVWASGESDFLKHLKELWFKLFNLPSLFTFKWREIAAGPRQFELKRKVAFASQFPFCRKIVEHFDKVWSALQDVQTEKRDLLFHSNIKSSKFNLALRDATSVCSVQVLEAFAHDLACLKHARGMKSSLETELVVRCMMKVFSAKQEIYEYSHQDISNHLACLYVLFENSRAAVKQISAMLEALPHILTAGKLKDFEKQHHGDVDFRAHLALFGVALEHIKTKYDSATDFVHYQELHDVISELKKTAWEIIQHPHSGEQGKDWKALEFSSLFMDHLIPQNLSTDLHAKFVSLLAPISKRLWKAARRSDLSSGTFLNVVIRALKSCEKEVALKYLLDWQDLRCRLCKKERVVNPVLLPCEHFMCKSCADNLPSARECPLCRRKFSEHVDISPARLSSQQVEKVEVFVSSCASFFLEYLSTFCFPTHVGDSAAKSIGENVNETLCKLLFSHETSQVLWSGKTAQFVDVRAIRSFIIQLLLRYSQENFEIALESYLTQAEGVFSDKLELMKLYIYCIEDSLLSQLQDRGDALEILEEQMNLIGRVDQLSQVQHLNVAANLRCVTRKLSELSNLNSDVTYNDMDDSNFVNQGAHLLRDVEIVKSFFVKISCRHFGTNWYGKMRQHGLWQLMTPVHLLRHNSAECSDMLPSSGEDYLASLCALHAISSTGSIDQVLLELHQRANKSIDSTVQVILAALSYLRAFQPNRSPRLKQTFVEKFTKTLQNCSHADSHMTFVFRRLLEQELLCEGGAFVRETLNDLVAVACLTLSLRKQRITEPLKNVMLHPDQFAEKYLPTMPQSNYFDVKDTVDQWVDEQFKVAPKAYQCPNGHIYFIGDCTNPIQDKAVCPDCQEPIGGDKYGVLKRGNDIGQVSEDSQVGYKLQTGDVAMDVVPERDCSKLSVCALRFLLHSAMLFASSTGDLSRVLQTDTYEDCQSLLTRQLENDLKQLGRFLGKSIADSALLLHQILKHIRQSTNIQCNSQASFDTLHGRRLWEAEFQRHCLAPVFSQADGRISDAQGVVLMSKELNDLDRLVYELSAPDIPADVEDNVTVQWSDSRLWRFQVSVSMKHFRQRLESVVASESGEGTILKFILDQTCLPILMHLEEIRNIQQAAHQRYFHKVDADQVDNITIREFLQESNCGLTERNMQLYIELWNKYKSEVSKHTVYQLPKEYVHPITVDSPVSMCLPSKLKTGRCALAFVEFAIDQQNLLLHKTRELLTHAPSFEQVSLGDLTSNDLIRIGSDEVLLPFVHANSQHEATITASGISHEIVYRIAALERQVLRRFILHKKLIDKQTIPLMEYLHDAGIGNECEKLKDNVKQELLPSKLLQALEQMKDGSRMADICEVVRTLTLVIQHLSKIGGDSDRGLRVYIREDLLLCAEEATLIPGSAKLCHTLSLFAWFSCQRSVKYVTSNQDPFKNVVKPENREKIKNLLKVDVMFATIPTDQLLLHLNSFLIMKDDIIPEISLREYLLAMAEEQDISANWLESMPEEIRCKHAAHLFQYAVEKTMLTRDFS